VTRKLRTIAQFGIRDPEAADSQITELPEPGSRGGTSMVSKTPNNDDPLRSSMISESPAHMQQSHQREELVPNNSSIMPELPLSLPPNHYHIDPTGLYDHEMPQSQEDARAAGASSQHFDLSKDVFEMPTESYSDSPDTEPAQSSDEEIFYDPNADPYHPYGDYTPHASEPDLTKRPQLTIVNSTVASPISSSDHNTTPTAFANTVAPNNPQSPYEDLGNPFARDIPATVPSFDFVTSSPPPRSPTRMSPPVASASLTHVVSSWSTSEPSSMPPTQPLPDLPAQRMPSNGRAALPSQQARFGNSNIGSPDAYRNMSPGNGSMPRPWEASDGYRVEGLPKEAILNATDVGQESWQGQGQGQSQGQGQGQGQGHIGGGRRARDREMEREWQRGSSGDAGGRGVLQSMSHNLQGQRQGSQVPGQSQSQSQLQLPPDTEGGRASIDSVSESVRRRYDGSEYDGYEY